MKNITRDEFYEGLYSGMEMYFKYHGITYFCQGFRSEKFDKDNPYCLCIEHYGEGIDSIRYLHEKRYKTVDARYRALLALPFLEGKTLEAVEDEIEFLEWG